MAYHLSVVEIREEINQQDTPPSSNLHTPQMTITHKSAKESASKESTMNSDSSDASGRKFGNFERPEEKIFKHNPKSDDDLFTKG